MEQDLNQFRSQLLLKGFGKEGQNNLFSSKILIIGLGGLGCPVLQILSSVGVGNLGLVDFDHIELKNLSRQPIYKKSDIGRLKVEVCLDLFEEDRSSTKFQIFPIKINNQNALKILDLYDFIIDCSDNFSTRYLLNDACLILNKPLIFGAISEYEGQLGVWNFPLELGRSTHYRDIFPFPPKSMNLLNCTDLGVLPSLTAIIGGFMANEAIKIGSKIALPYINRMFTYNALKNSSYEFIIHKSNNYGEFPKNEAEFLNYNYPDHCENFDITAPTISPELFIQWKNRTDILFIDVRETHEIPILKGFPSISIPLSRWTSIPEPKEDILILYCTTGKRSQIGAEKLIQYFGPRKKVYSLMGGINALSGLI